MKKQTSNEKPMDFKEALAYLQKKGFPLTDWSLRKEVQSYPERLGAVRRNPVKLRGKGGRFFFYKSKLDAYQPYQVLTKA